MQESHGVMKAPDPQSKPDCPVYGSENWIPLGFGALGFLIGNLVGLTSHSIVLPLLSLLFAFTGSSILALLSKLTTQDRRLAGQSIFALALSCLLGAYSGIAVSEWRLLSPPALRQSSGVAAAGDPSKNKYLNSQTTRQVDAIDVEYRNKVLSGEQAYEELRALVLPK